MLQGKTITEMAEEIQRIASERVDHILPTKALEARVVDNKVTLNFEDSDSKEVSVGLNNHAGGQLAGFTDVPTRYYRKLEAENPQLLADNINHGLELKAKSDKGRMIRTLDGKARAILSASFKPLDSHELLETVLPIIMDPKNPMEIVSSQITEQKVYIKCLSPKLKADIKLKDLNVNDTIQYGLVISNSDVGAGSLRIEPMIYRLICKNGMIANTAMKRFHTGRNLLEEEVYKLLDHKTIELDNKVFWMKVSDLVKASMETVNFERQVEEVQKAALEGLEVPNNWIVDNTVDRIMKTVKITGEAKKNGILAALASGNEGAGLTRWGLVNAVTKAAHTTEGISYEDSIEMERAGGKILELSPSQFQSLAG